MRDVVVVGSGHNALVAACYLARAGLDVEVVERDGVLGGAVSTVQRFPGYAVDRGSSAHIMIRHTGIDADLELADHGLTYLDLDPWGYAPFGEQAITFHRDLAATCASIESVCGSRDADHYHAWATDWADRNERVFAAFGGPPTPGRLGRTVLGLGRRLPGGEVARQFLTTGDHLLDEHFDDERLKTALAWMGAQAGPPPHEVATADLVGWVPLMHRRPPGRPVGGSGALTQALASRLVKDGGTIRLGDGAAAILVRDGHTRGVRTSSGDTVAARVVLAGCHVLTTVDLLGAGLPAAVRSRVRGSTRVGNGLGMAVRLGTTSLPRYRAGDDPNAHRGLQLLCADRRMLAAAYGDFLAGRTPARPPVVVMTFSAIDPSIAPRGRHNITIWGQWHPYSLAGGTTWAAERDRAADAMIATVEAAAPGFTASIEHVHVQSPYDLERELGLLRGNVMHVEMGLDAMFALRPLPELAGYRMPGLRGMYLTGASTHPGGGVSGASGRSSAGVILSDLRRATRKSAARPVSHMVSQILSQARTARRSP
jgi:phytoene dehydrogenase-like protein